MKSTSVLSLGLTTAILFASSVSAALLMTPIQTGTYSSSSDFFGTDFGSPDEIGVVFQTGFAEPVSGIKKFDGSLGTLKEIKLSLSTEGYYFAALEEGERSFDLGGESVNFGVPIDFGASYADYFGSFQNDIIYRPTGASSAFQALGESFAFDASLFGSIEETTDFGPSTIEGTVEVTGDSFFASNFLESDFVGDGTEDVDTLLAGFFIGIFADQLDTDGDPSNIFLDAGIVVYEGEITVQYLYDNGAVIPEPAAASALVGLIALGGLALRRRR